MCIPNRAQDPKTENNFRMTDAVAHPSELGRNVYAIE